MKHITIIISLLFSIITTAGAADPGPLSTEELRQVRTQARELTNAGIPESAAVEMLTAMVQNRFSSDAQSQARNIVAASVKAGLPHGPLIEKTMEGIAKGAGDKQIVSALQAVADRYANSFQMARELKQSGQKTDRLSEIIAGCLASGMEPGDMKGLARTISEQAKNNQADPETAIRTMQVARTMARRGVKSGTIKDVLTTAVKTGMSMEEMVQLQQQERHQFEGNQNSKASGNQGGSSAGRGGSGNSSGGQGGSGGSDGGGGKGGNGSGGSGRGQ